MELGHIKKHQTHLRATVTLLLGLLITLQPLAIHAFDAPWDQGHRTTHSTLKGTHILDISRRPR